MENFKIYRGIEFLKIVLSELSNPQVIRTDRHPALSHMWRRMQDIRFNPKKETFDYRSEHFPRFMRHLYIEYPDIPKEFRDYADDGMIFDLIAGFVRENVLAHELDDVLQNQDVNERTYMFFCFQFFAAMEDKQVEKLGMERGEVTSVPAVIAEGEDGSLEALTGEDLNERKKNKKTKIIAWNPFGENNLDCMMEVCRKKGEMDIISHIKDGGFEVMDLQKTDAGFTKIVAENKSTSQRVEIYTDKFGAPKHFIDTAAPAKREDFKGKNWRDELMIFASKAGKNPDVIANKAEEVSAAGPLKGDPRSSEISTGTLKVADKALEEALGIKAGSERSEFYGKPIGESTTEHLTEAPEGIAKTRLPFAPIQRSTIAVPREIGSGVEEDILESDASQPREAHRQRLTESGEITGRRPNRPNRRTEEKQAMQTSKKRKKTLADNAVIGSGIAAVLGTAGVVSTTFLT